jgi:hypothetical protein
MLRRIFPGPDASVSAEQLVPIARRNPSANDPVENLVFLDDAPYRTVCGLAIPARYSRGRDEHEDQALVREVQEGLG